MFIILGYATELPVSELINLTLSSFHLDTPILHISILGNGFIYRNVLLMDKAIRHLDTYLLEFHTARE